MADNKMMVSALGSELAHDPAFPVLNHKGFVRAETSIDQWHALVTEAWGSTNVPTNTEILDYLVLMLDRFTAQADLLAQLGAFDYVQYSLSTRRTDDSSRQNLADISLQYVSFFSEMSKHRHEPRSLEYSTQIGVSLYQELAEQSGSKDDWFSSAFRAMAQFFNEAVIILRSIFPTFRIKNNTPPADFAKQLKTFDLFHFEQPNTSVSIN